MVKAKVLLIGGDEMGYHDFKLLGTVLETFLTAAGFSVTQSCNLNMFLPSHIKDFDAIVCYLNKEKINKKQEQGLLQGIIGSPAGNTGRPKGFVGIHIAVCTFLHSDAYHKMLGARLLTHPEMGEEYTFEVSNPRHPVMSGIKDFALVDEFYLLELYPPFETVLSCDFRGFTHPVAWVKPYGLGRVFYTSIGHGQDQLTNPFFQKMIINAVNWSVGAV
jgi:type 1 glutamine amidotransferase